MKIIELPEERRMVEHVKPRMVIEVPDSAEIVNGKMRVRGNVWIDLRMLAYAEQCGVRDVTYPPAHDGESSAINKRAESREA